jgi:hypothetical protein
MFRRPLALFLAIGLIMVAGPVWAGQDDQFSLPAGAKKIRENVYDLGISVDPVSGRQVRGRAFVHNPRHGTENSTNSTSHCYGYIAGGAKWAQKENFLLNPANRSRIPSSTVLAVFNDAFTKWEEAAGTSEEAPKDIVGTAVVTSANLKADYGRPDGKNELYFGGISGGSIGVTIVWYFTTTKEIVETDQIYNDRSFGWATNGDPTKMDLDNIVTHEHGHVFGMDDIYDSTCSKVTMYGYASFGETDKRTLEPEDVAGIDALYN